MGAFSKATNGWQLAINSIKVLKANKQLIVFPILSAFSSLLVFACFSIAVFAGAGWHLHDVQLTRGEGYLLLFLFYIANYFVVVFFNMALIYCAGLYFNGEEVSITKGLQFSASRVHVIFLWAIFSATVGTFLKAMQQNFGWLGKIITAALGIIWSIATFLVVPVLAYEKLGPIDAVKRSAKLMKEKWGQGVTTAFSFALMMFLFIIVLATASIGMSYWMNEVVGIALFASGILLALIIFSTLQSIFISALYSNINGNDNTHFPKTLLDGAFQ